MHGEWHRQSGWQHANRQQHCSTRSRTVRDTQQHCFSAKQRNVERSVWRTRWDMQSVRDGRRRLIVEGGQANEFGSNPAGAFPVFANTGYAFFYWYYIVVHSSTYGSSSPYMTGYANTSGAGPINVLWNQIGNTGTISYDVLRQTGYSSSPPNGTGGYAVATGLLASNVCSNNVCSFTDQ